MKNTIQIKLILNLFFICFFSTCLLSQWAINNKAQQVDEFSYFVNEDCEYVACFHTYVYDPTGVFTSSAEDDNSSFGDDEEILYPPMFLRVMIKDIDETFPLTEWTYCSDYVNEDLTPITGLFKSTVCVNIGLIEGCLEGIGSNDEPIELDPTKTVEIPYTVQLLTLYDMYFSDGNSTSYAPYPICDYKEVNEIFSCEVFESTAPFCELSFGSLTCSNSNLYENPGELVLECENCVNAFDPFKEEGPSKTETRKVKFSEISISPNPFVHEVNISNLGLQEMTTIRIINSLGQTINTFNTTEPQLSISTKNLDNGFYYLVVQQGDTSEVFKVLKQ